MPLRPTRWDSPLEEKFFDAYLINIVATKSSGAIKTGIFPQYEVGKFRLDFLIGLKVDGYDPVFCGVEIDGHEFHEKTKEQAARDKARDRFILQQGFPVIHFTGSEIFRDADTCAYEAYLTLRRRSEG